MIHRILNRCARLLARPSLLKVHQLVALAGLRGAGFFNHEDFVVSGERAVITRLLRPIERPVVVDVGAHVGEYARMVREVCPDAAIFSFEPHPESLAALLRDPPAPPFVALGQACGSAAARATLYDPDPEPDAGSPHSSLLRSVAQSATQGAPRAIDVEVTTIDAFVRERGIERIHLLKIDAEGGEHDVLRGARNAIARGAIDLVQLEMNSTTARSGHGLRELIDLLPGFRLHRLLPRGPVPLDAYEPMFRELFVFQNLLAVRERRE